MKRDISFDTPDDMSSLKTQCRLLRFPDDLYNRLLINSLLLYLTDARFWGSVGNLNEIDAASMWSEILYNMVDNYCIVGTIVAHVRAELPHHMLPCDGSIHSADDYPNLYDVLDNQFKVGLNQFRTPDLRGRTIVGTGWAGELVQPKSLDEAFGSESESLTIAQMPMHSHTYQQSVAGIINGGIEAPASAMVATIPALTSSEGFGEAHNNLQPSRALHYAIIAK